MPAYLTFDIGTTALKTALVGEDGRIRAVHEVDYSPRHPQPNHVEMDPQDYWQAAVEGARMVVDDPAEVGAIGFSSQGQSFVSLDEKGRPLRDCIVWVDNRARKLADRWADEWLDADEYRAICGYPWIAAGLTLFKIGWLAENDPEAHDAAHHLCLPDYLIYRMTGQLATDYNIAQMSGMYDIREGCWSQKLLDHAGISADQLPEVHRPGTAVGTLLPGPAQELGLAEGTDICVGANDQLCAAIGAGNVRPGIITETTGTALAVIASTERVLDDDRMYVGIHAAEDLYYAMPFANTAAVVLTWFRDLCCPDTEYEDFLADVEEVEIGADGLTVLPHFAGSNCPDFNPDARGIIDGLTLGHKRAHIARAIMESCACLLHELLEPVKAHDVPVGRVRSLGRSARSDLWLQMKADLLGVDVERPECSDAASLGAAMLAARGTGQFATLREAADAWYRPAEIFQPQPENREAYQEVYRRYRRLFEKM